METQMPDISGDLNALEWAVKNKPNPNLIIWAGEILAANPRENLPDWVECLANGNPEAWESVIAVTLEEMTLTPAPLPGVEGEEEEGAE
jgi:hypothetical protein